MAAATKATLPSSAPCRLQALPAKNGPVLAIRPWAGRVNQPSRAGWSGRPAGPDRAGRRPAGRENCFDVLCLNIILRVLLLGRYCGCMKQGRLARPAVTRLT